MIADEENERLLFYSVTSADLRSLALSLEKHEVAARYREMPIDEAIVLLGRKSPTRPELDAVILRIEQLRDERDNYYRLAGKVMREAAWEKSDVKKWADKQLRDPDND